MRIFKGDQTERDRNHARRRLSEVEGLIDAARARYFAALPLRDNETMDREAANINGLNLEAEGLRRVLTVGS